MSRETNNRSRSRFARLKFEPLEPRLCLAAEFGFALTASQLDSWDGFIDVEVDAGGNFYVASYRDLRKFSSDRTLLWEAPIDQIRELELDAAGNVYALGSKGTVSSRDVRGEVILADSAYSDVFVIKLNPQGHAVWGRGFGNAEHQEPGTFAVNPEGHVLLAGSFRNSLTFDSVTLTTAGSVDVFITRLSTSGTVEWARRMASAGWDKATGIDFDAAGNGYITSQLEGQTTFSGLQGEIVLQQTDVGDSYVLKMNPTGDFVWGISLGNNSGRVDTYALTVDPTGSVVVSGIFSDKVDFDPSAEVYHLRGAEDFFVLKLDLDGQFDWVRPFFGSCDAFCAPGMPAELAIGPDGQIHYAGYFRDTLDVAPWAGGHLLTATWDDPLLVTLTAEGELLAARRWDTVGTARGVTTDAAGNVYVVGRDTGYDDPVDYDPGPGTHLLVRDGNTDGFLVQLTPPRGVIGNRVWNDVSGDGIQDPTETGLAGAVVELHSSEDDVRGNADDGRVAIFTTDATGDYRFENLPSGNYYLVVRTPVGYVYSPANAGGDEAVDSDVLATGQTEMLLLQPNQEQLDLDIGLTGIAPGFGFAVRAGAANGQTQGNRLVLDGAGNSYVTGLFQRTVDFDPGPTAFNLTAYGTGFSTDAFVAKYSATGALVWVRQFEGSYNDSGVDIAINSAGEVYVTGQFNEQLDIDPGPYETIVYHKADFDVFVAKLTRDGDFMWGKTIGGYGIDRQGSLELDPAGNLVIGGVFSETVDFNPSPAAEYSLTSAGGTDAFLLKLDADGHFISANSWGGTGPEDLRDLDVDAAGNVFVIGSFRGTVDFDPTVGTYPLTSAGGADGYLLKLHADGTLAWAVRQGNANDDIENNAVRVDAEGNVYSAGAFRGFLDFGDGRLRGNANFVGYVSKRNSNGQLVWVRDVPAGQHAFMHGLDVDMAGNIYASGNYGSTAWFTDSTGAFFYYGATNSQNAFVQKMNLAGDHQATYLLAGPSNGTASARSVVVDPVSGRLLATGMATGAVDFDPGNGTYSPPASGGTDFFLVQLRQVAQPRITLTGNSVIENQGNQFVGTLAVTNGLPGETFTFTKSAIGAGAFTVQGNQVFTNTTLFNYESAPQASVQIQAQGSLGTFLNQVLPIQVLNVNEPPAVAFITSPQAAAGESWERIGVFSDPDLVDSWTATIDYGDGGGVQPLAVLPNRSYALNHVYANAGRYNLTITVTDAEGLTGTRTMPIDVLPHLELSGPISAVPGEVLSFSTSLTKMPASGEYALIWHFGDGSTAAQLVSGDGTYSQSHVFNSTGAHPVQVILTLPNAQNLADVVQVEVNTTNIQVDAVDPTKKTLFVGGTNEKEIIRVLHAGLNGVRVTMRGEVLGTFDDIQRVVVYGQGGNDMILGSSHGQIDFQFHGGDGNDILVGSRGDDALLGEGGNDLLLGGDGRDLLVGGTGGDRLFGQAGGDLLIAASLQLPDLKAGIVNIMAEWTSIRTFEDRAANLRGDLVGPRANNDTLLLVASTVIEDNDVDWLWGSNSPDWFFTNLSEDQAQIDESTDLVHNLAE